MKKKTNHFFIIISIGLVILMIIAATKLYLWNRENKKSSNIIEEIAKEITQDTNKKEDDISRYNVKIETILQKNPDTVAWLKVNGTNIEYAVVKGKDNNYYLNHSFDKSKNYAGWVFADCKNKIDGTDNNIVIYGHNRKDGSMFGTLKNILTKQWYDKIENRKIILVTKQQEKLYEVFSVYKIKKETYYAQTTFTDDTYKEFLTTIKQRSIKDFNVNITHEDKILTLTTCADNNKYRVVLHAKEI